MILHSVHFLWLGVWHDGCRYFLSFRFCDVPNVYTLILLSLSAVL